MSSSTYQRNIEPGRCRVKHTKSLLTPEQRAQFLERRRYHQGKVPRPDYIILSSSEDEDGAPEPPRRPPVLPIPAPLRWERVMTEHICHRSGVLHFPKHVGRRLSDAGNSIVLRVNGTGRDYKCSIKTTTRTTGEKYLHGTVWLDLVKGQCLKVGDILKFELRGSSLTIYVDIVRV